MITLQFSANGTIPSKGIRLVTWSEFSHVDLVMPDGRLFGAVGLNARPGSWRGGVSFHEPRNDYTRLERRVFDCPDNYLDVLLSLDGKSYDWLGGAGILLHRDWAREDFFGCASLQQYVSMRIGMPLLNLEKWWRATPELLLCSPLLKPV